MDINGDHRAVKMSILSLYLRLTPIQSHRLMIYIIMGIINAHLVAAVIVRENPNRYYLKL